MKRDMDLVRRMALATAELPAGSKLESLDGVEDAAFITHAEWMMEAGLVVGRKQVAGAEETVELAWILRLTWEGCDFVDAVRDDTMWKKAKEKVLKPTMSFTFGLLKDFLAMELRQQLTSLR